MLKKIILWFFGLVILLVAAAGGYIYMLDWNQHKTMIETRFSQITGLSTRIDGNLQVELLPVPKFSANLVKFFKPTDRANPLIDINQISASVDLWKLLDKKFILKSMTLTQMSIHVTVNENGELNWKGIGASSTNRSGNIEISFDDVRLVNSALNYENQKDKKNFEIGNISARVNAPSLKGPYQTDGKFIFNNSEITFRGNIIKNNEFIVNATLENPSTASKAILEGTLGSNAHGSFTFDTAHLQSVSSVMFGDKGLKEYYEAPFYTSFKYSSESDVLKLDNFNISYGRDTKGSGNVLIQNLADKTKFQADFDMTQFNLNTVQYIIGDFYSYFKSGQTIDAAKYAGLSGDFNLKSANVTYNDVASSNLNLGMGLDSNIINIKRFGLDMPGDTSIKAAGSVDFNNEPSYQFEQTVKTADLRVLASIFKIDLAKLASADNKKNIFKKAEANLKYSGDLNNLKISIIDSSIDSSSIKGNLGFIDSEDKTFVIADLRATKVLFDRYLEIVPQSLADASFENKLVHQLKLIPFSHDLDIDAQVNIDSAVYNQIPLENVLLEVKLHDDSLNISKLSINSIAGATLNLSAEASDIYSKPLFKELSYSIRSSNFPQFISALNIDTGKYNLFKRKIFASQGALSGTLTDFSLSSVQKFGDTEFSYTGTVSNAEDDTLVDGELELKTNNFTSFIQALSFDYKPDLPVTAFALEGKLKGSARNFALENLTSHLGANAITGNLQFDNVESTPKLVANLNFDKFDADRLFNLSKKNILPELSSEGHTFVARPILDEQKIDYSALKSVDFNIQGKARQLIYCSKNYTDAVLNTVLKDGVLQVADLNANDGTSSINLKFILNTNNVPSIEGSYAFKSLKLPHMGGSTYILEGGQLNADGTFKSLATTQKDFFENINSRGKFQLLTTAVTGWDLDVIKFELEQRKSVAGFEDSIINNLSSGRSIFSSISGKYDIIKGLIKADGVMWKSPVVNISMDFDLNLANWLFNGKFNAIYMNASFSDVLKYTFSGNMSNPTVSVDLSDSIQRISKTETIINSAKDTKKKEQQNKLIGKITLLKTDADELLKDCSRMILDVERFRPITDSGNVQKVYDNNIQLIQETEQRLTDILANLNKSPNEKTLDSIEAELNTYRSKLNFIPKSLEDNFVVDSKYVFDDIFNKIAWVYNVAQNNSSYYETISNAYMDRIKLLEDSDNPVDEEKKVELATEVKSIVKDMDTITALHNKVRENYLSVIDASKISEMNENIEISTHALKNILSYTERMDNKIVNSIDNFRAVLDISTRDYDQYMIYPPLSIEDIDITKPTVPNFDAEGSDSVSTNQEEVEDSSPSETTEENTEDKKKVDTSVDNDEKKSSANLSQLISSELISSNFSFKGLSGLIKEKSDKTEKIAVAPESVQEEVAVKEENSDTSVVVADASPVVADASPVVHVIDEDFSEKKSTDILSDNLTKEVIAEDIEPIQTIAISTDSEKILAKTDATSSLFVEAIDSEVKSFISENPLTESIPESKEDISVADNFSVELVEPEEKIATETSSLKTNPVVAMEIGKEKQTIDAKEVNISLPHKTGFKKAKSPVKVADAVVAESTVDTKIENRIKTSKSIKKKFVSAAKKAKMQNDISKIALIDILSSENKHKNLVTSAKNLLSDVPVYIETPSNSEENRYIYASETKNIPFFGHIGKKMLLHKQSSLKNLPIVHQYVFASAPGSSYTFSGTVEKNTSLYVK